MLFSQISASSAVYSHKKLIGCILNRIFYKYVEESILLSFFIPNLILSDHLIYTAANFTHTK